ncbi:MAG: hypothetical protein K0Q51_1137 [Rickettsiaceae bacterium]|jgi:hypothetical protein|nr:hypothetical protein [Rickettsiaceae bacterium]
MAKSSETEYPPQNNRPINKAEWTPRKGLAKIVEPGAEWWNRASYDIKKYKILKKEGKTARAYWQAFKGVLKVPSNIILGVGAVGQMACNTLGEGFKGVDKLSSILLNKCHEGVKETSGWKNVGYRFAGGLAAIPKVFVGAPCSIIGKGFEGMGRLVRDAAHIAGDPLRTINPINMARRVINNTGRLFSNMIQVPIDLTKEAGTQIKDIGNKTDIPLVSPLIRVAGGVVQGVGQIAEGVHLGLRNIPLVPGGKTSMLERLKMAGKLSGFGIAAGFRTMGIDAAIAGERIGRGAINKAIKVMNIARDDEIGKLPPSKMYNKFRDDASERHVKKNGQTVEAALKGIDEQKMKEIHSTRDKMVDRIMGSASKGSKVAPTKLPEPQRTGQSTQAETVIPDSAAQIVKPVVPEKPKFATPPPPAPTALKPEQAAETNLATPQAPAASMAKKTPPSLPPKPSSEFIANIKKFSTVRDTKGSQKPPPIPAGGAPSPKRGPRVP